MLEKTTIQQLIIHATNKLNSAGIDNSYLDANILFSVASGMDKEHIVKNYKDIVENNVMERFYQLVSERLNFVPIAHLRGYQEFWSLNFKVNNSTLIPRPDSELLVASVLKYNNIKTAKIIDLGTGSGCLILSILSELKKAQGYGVDLSSEAIRIAKENAKLLNLNERVKFSNLDWKEIPDNDFDILISNPPYIPTNDITLLQNELDYEPISALDGGQDGMTCYNEIVKLVPKILKPSGLGFFEFGIGQKQQICWLLEKNNLQIINIENDLAGIPRIVIFKKP